MQTTTTAKRTRKPSAAKPVAASKPAPVAATPAKPEAKPDNSEQRAAERIAARVAIIGYYSGRSLPFKAASDTFAPFRTDKPAKAATTRQAALIAAMLISGDNIKPDGTFTRGGFTFDGRAVQPETGCLSDQHGRTVHHVSGPLAGKQARDAIFRLDLEAAEREIRANLGDKLGKLALAKLAILRAA